MFFVPKKRKEKFKKEYDIYAVRRLTGLLTFMDNSINLSEREILIGVNKFFNQFLYKSDIKTYRKKDYWASPLEFIGKGQGDCEDFAVAKFLTLLELGIPVNKLFLTFVKLNGIAHIVVTYYQKPQAVPLVLDNYNKTILPLNLRNLNPVYSFTACDLYIQKKQGIGKKIIRKPLRTQMNLKGIKLEIMK